MYLVAPYGTKRKWDVRLRNHDGTVVKVPGDYDKTVARRIGDRVELLFRAKQNGEQSPGELTPWIASMPQSLADRLVGLGLLTAGRLQRTRPLDEHIQQFGRIVAARKTNRAKHARQQEQKVRRVFADLKLGRPDELTATALTTYLKGLGVAASTRRAYVIALKDFADEMVRLGVLRENPLAHVKPPGQYENPECERQPMTVEQFRRLAKHLDTFERYRDQKSRWTAHDRRLIYWTAVKTGYRQSEMRALIKADLHLDGSPAVVSLKARHTKNKTEGEVPIPADLAAALRAYTAGLGPTDRVFPFPSTSGSIVDMLRLDLKGAGIAWKLPTGEVIDFHTLRSTAITWWLDVDGLPPERVQVLARLKTLALVYTYSRNLRLEDWSWLDRGPKLVAPTRSKTAG